jgi:hypothetical protein
MEVLMTRWSLVLLPLVLFGCNGGEPEETGDPNPTPQPTPDPDTGDTGDSGFEPFAFTVVGEFAINDQGQAVGYTTQDQTGATVQAPAAVTVLIVAEEALTGAPLNTSNSCSVTFGGQGPYDAAQWATDAGIYWGVTMPAGTPILSDTCGSLAFPAEWGTDIGSIVAQWDWGVGLNVMDPQIEAQLPAALGAQWTVLEPAVIGAGWYSNAVFGLEASGYLDGGFAFAQELDASLTAQFDGAGAPVLLDASDVWFSGAAQPGVGAYAAQGIVSVQPAGLLIAGPQ